jgi:tetratricopeptide (TPR) repeat protein
MVASQVHYADLEIRILERQGAGYPVELTLDGEQEFPRGYLSPDLLPWVPSATPAEDGERLFQLLLADDRLRAAWAEVRGQTPLRRVHLRIDESAPELHALPWELLRELGSGVPPQTLAATVATPFSRDLAGKWLSVTPVAERPVKLLVVIANPNDLADYRLPAIDVAAEQRSIEAAVAGLGEGLLELSFLKPPVTLARLEAELKAGGAHILHIVAHGMYHPQRARAILFLADEANQVQRVGEEAFAEMLARQRETLRLVFLASCQTATRSPADAFRGFAPQLISAGVPAVVAMQDLVPVETARAFTATFYRQLLDHGLVDLAVNEARSILMSGDMAGSWSVPVLFSRVPAGRLVVGTTSRLQRLRQHPAVARLLVIRNMILAVVGLIALVLGLSVDIDAARQSGGILHPILPAPAPTPTPIPPMPSGFNVAVAQFTMRDATGKLVSTDASRELSDWLFDAIKQETEQLPAPLRANPRAPNVIGPIVGEDRANRAAAAAQIASAQNITVLIYGVVSKSADGYQVDPEFYVTDQSFAYGSEIAGSNRLGLPVAFTLPLEPGTQLEINKTLNARAQALKYLVTGLANYQVRYYDTAWSAFRDAANVADWPDIEGKEVVYLLIGAAKLRVYDEATDPAQRAQALVEASQAFSQTVRLNRDYARGYLGLGTVALEQAQGAAGIDAAKLAEAARWYTASLHATDRPAASYVQVKAAYGLGQVHLAGVEHQQPGWSREQAHQYFTQVIQAYAEKHTPALALTASQAYGNLGWLAGRAGDWPAMAAECHKAIDILTGMPKPSRQWLARYWSWIGIAEKQQEHRDTARDAFRKAIELGTGSVDAEELADWQARLKRVE